MEYINSKGFAHACFPYFPDVIGRIQGGKIHKTFSVIFRNGTFFWRQVFQEAMNNGAEMPNGGVVMSHRTGPGARNSNNLLEDAGYNTSRNARLPILEDIETDEFIQADTFIYGFIDIILNPIRLQKN